MLKVPDPHPWPRAQVLYGMGEYLAAMIFLVHCTTEHAGEDGGTLPSALHHPHPRCHWGVLLWGCNVCFQYPSAFIY